MHAYFIGIGGMGMSAIAKILHEEGFAVAGSDRNTEGDFCKRLAAEGIKIYPQDGSGIEAFMRDKSLSSEEIVAVKSGAVEAKVSDVIKATELGIKQMMRSDLLAKLFNEKKGIAVAGTAGKTTVTGIIAWLLKEGGLDPSCASGGIIKEFDTNAFAGKGEYFVIEADESDGSIVKYFPEIAILTNIYKDHKPIEELAELFSTFLEQTSGKKIVCCDDPEAAKLAEKYSAVTCRTSGKADFLATDITEAQDFTSFKCNGVDFKTSLRGLHNVRNILVAVAAAYFAGVSLEQSAKAISSFSGMNRRFEFVGEARGVKVIDDFAHNPIEIAMAIETARKMSDQLFCIYQPHGFGPARFTRDELIEVFASLKKGEKLYVDDIYYGGGTVTKDISSEELVKEARKISDRVFYLPSREAVAKEIVSEAKTGAIVLVMGARDINAICGDILERLKKG